MIAALSRAALWLAAACTVAAAGAAANAAANAATSATAGSTNKVRSFATDSFRHIVASHQGKPFVVVVWAIDCDYCLPSFKALAQAQRHRRLGVVTIATDRADDAEAVRYVVQKIHAAGLASETWAFGDAPAEQLRYSIDPKWRGEMPRSYWFDSHGKMVAHSGVITTDTIAELTHASQSRRAQE